MSSIGAGQRLRRWAAIAVVHGLVGWADGGAGGGGGGPAADGDLDEGQVTSQVASFAATKLKDSPAVVTVITQEEIKSSGARDLVDVLSLVPGFFLGADLYGVVGPGFRGLWGYEGKILLLIDGKEMNELLYSTMQLGNEFPIELVERIEVVRGPGSVVYGGNAELAVINVVTRSLQGATDFMAAGTYGQQDFADPARGYGRRSLTASGRYVVDEVPGLSLFASGSIGQGHRSTRPYLDPDGQSAPSLGTSRLDPMVAQLGVGFRGINATFLYHHLSVASPVGQGPVSRPSTSLFDTFVGDVTGSFHLTNRFELAPRLTFTFQEPWRTSDPASPYYYDKSVWRTKARLVARWAPLDWLQLTAGADAIFDHAQLNGAATGLQTPFASGGDTIDYRTFAGFLEAFSENPIVNFAVGARYDNNDAVGGSLVPRVVLLKSFGPVGLKALFSMAFRWPSIENLSDAEATLSPESTRVLELEGSWDIVKNVRLSANVFDIGLTAPIAYSYNPETGNETYQNLGRQGSRGVELAFRARGDWGRVEATYSFYVPTFIDHVETYTAPGRTDMFLAAPAHRASLAGTWKPLAWLGVTPSLAILGPRLGYLQPSGGAVAPSVAEQPTQVLANLFVYLDGVPAKGLFIGLGVYNLFGVDFAYLQPYRGTAGPLPGLDREVLLKVGYTFEPEG